MTVRDALAVVSNAQSLAGTASVVSTNSIPLAAGLAPGGGARFLDIGAGQANRFRVHVTQSLDAAHFLTAEVIVATNAALTTGVVALHAMTVATGTATAGKEFDVAIPPMTQAYITTLNATHIGLRFKSDAAFVWTTGAVSAWFTRDKRSGRPRRYQQNVVFPA